MGIRFWLSRLGEARHRRTATRWLLTLALGGFGLTMLVLIATGRGTGRWFFALAVWLALIFIPLWLVTQVFQTLGPTLRRRLSAGLAGREDRYRRPSTVTLIVEDLLERQVVMPRIATPVAAQKARDAAVALVVRANRQGDVLETLRGSLTRCLVGVEAWARDVGGWAAAAAPENIQARWGTVRALAALAALSKTLVAVYEDRAGGGVGPHLDGRSLHLFLDNTLDFCDDLALQVEVPAWEEPPLDLPPDPAVPAQIRQAWQHYADTPEPAPTALEAFLAVALPG